MSLLAARIGTIIHFNAPHTPTGKAKIERLFRSMKDHWMSQLNISEFKSIDELYSSLLNYVNQYNKKVHSSLNGKTPENRFFEESMFIKRLDADTIETSFLLEYERKVSADNVITINNTEYEVPYIYAKQKITLRYSVDLKQVYVVDRTTEDLTENKLLNKHNNSHIKRNKVRLTNWEE